MKLKTFLLKSIKDKKNGYFLTTQNWTILKIIYKKLEKD